MVRENAPGVICTPGKQELGHSTFLSSEVYTCVSRTPILRFQTSNPWLYALVAWSQPHIYTHMGFGIHPRVRHQKHGLSSKKKGNLLFVSMAMYFLMTMYFLTRRFYFFDAHEPQWTSKNMWSSKHIYGHQNQWNCCFDAHIIFFWRSYALL